MRDVVPTLVVETGLDREQERRAFVIEFKQIICPVDFSESSVRALAHAAPSHGGTTRS